jgi:hypothetical protein
MSILGWTGRDDSQDYFEEEEEVRRMKADPETIYDCEVKRLYMRDGEKRWQWVTASVSDAVGHGDTHYRCKDCHGAVKLHGKNVANGPAPHVEHKSRQDSEYCPAGIYFRQNPGRERRLSTKPVE